MSVVITFEELLTEFFMERWQAKVTQNGYLVSVRALRRFIEKNHPDLTIFPETINRAMVLNWRYTCVKKAGVEEGTLCEVSWNTYARHLKALFKFGIERELLPISENPFHKTELKTPKRKPKTLPPGAIQQIRLLLRLYESVENKTPEYIYPAWFWRIMVEMFYHTGIRLRQLLNIELADIDLAGQQLICSAAGAKNNTENCLPLHGELLPLLQELVDRSIRRGAKPSDQLFNVNRFSHRHQLKTMNTDQVEAFFSRLSHKLGVRVSPHRFRHTLGTELMAGERADIHLTQRMLCHENIRSTLVYVDVPLNKLHDYLLQRQQAR